MNEYDVDNSKMYRCLGGNDVSYGKVTTIVDILENMQAIKQMFMEVKWTIENKRNFKCGTFKIFVKITILSA